MSQQERLSSQAQDPHLQTPIGIKHIPAHESNYAVYPTQRQIKRVILHVSQGHKAGDISVMQHPTGYRSYHLYIPKDGEVIMFVPFNDVAYHCMGCNTDSIGIAFEGRGEDYVPTEYQLNAAIGLIAGILTASELYPSAETIEPHSKYRPTKCPAGTPMQQIIDAVRNLMDPLLEVLVIHTGSEEHVQRGKFAVSIDGRRVIGRRVDVRLVE